MDIVEQLRKCANTVFTQDGYTFRLGLQNEAADEIERLRKQNTVLETELALVRSMLPNVKIYQTGTGDFAALKEGE